MSPARVCTPRVVSVCLFCLLFLIAAPAFAGILDGNPNATSFPTYSGSGNFSNGPLAGTLDYAVFTAAEFTAAFPSSTYSPNGAVIYTYQLENTGTVAISTEIVGIANPASEIGSFQYAAGEQAPSSAFFSSGNAVWQYISPNSLDLGEMSYIMAFSSPNTPMAGASLTIDGGTPAVLTGIPTPSANPIPEPTNLVLLILGGLCLLGMRKRR